MKRLGVIREKLIFQLEDVDLQHNVQILIYVHI